MSSDAFRRRAHARVTAALERLRDSDLSPWRDQAPPPLLLKGVEEFNHGEFFEQHETLEELWRAEREVVRYLYQGILQIGVGFLHLERGNLHGAVVKLENGLALLEAFEPCYMGLDIAGLRRDSRAWLVRLLDSEHVKPLERSALPVIRMTAHPRG